MKDMKFICENKPCAICHGRLKESNSKDISRLLPTKKTMIREWYGICDFCFDRYPEIIESFRMEPEVHKIMFNLIDSIKTHFWGDRFIPPYKPKN